MIDSGLYTLENKYVDWNELCSCGKVSVVNNQLDSIDESMKGSLIVPSNLTFSENLNKRHTSFLIISYDFEKEVAPVW